MRRAIAVALAVGALTAAPAHASFPGTNGKLATSVLDAGGGFDIYSLNADGTGITPLATGADTDSNASWSPDGRRIAFDSTRDGNTEIYVMDEDGTDVTRLTTSLFPDQNPSWSPDGTRIVFESTRAANNRDLWLMNADGSNQTRLTIHPAEDRNPAWSPDGTRVAFDSDRESYTCEDPENPFCYVRPTSRIFTMAPDGTNQARRVTTSEPNDCFDGEDVFAPDWSPDGTALVYESFEFDFCGLEEYLHMFVVTGPGGTVVHSESDGSRQPRGSAWSPDGQEIAIASRTTGGLMAVRRNGTGLRQIVGCCYRWPSWQPRLGYPRPRSASPVYVSLVPAYEPCASPNRTHGPPLASPSCNPPAQRSGALTVGTADANGRPTQSMGFAWADARIDATGTPADEADVRLKVKVTDIRRQSDLGDYTGELQARLGIRVTDKDNTVGPGVGTAATVQDFDLSWAVPCVATADASIGSQCELSTTAEALVPASLTGGKRAVWQLDRYELLDGGPDGDADTPDNSLFAVQGVFVP